MPQKPKYQLKSLKLGEETIGPRLARLRKEKGYTQTELAKRIGISQVLISDYERERLRISADMVTRLALALEVTSDEILGLTKTKRKNFGKNMLRRMSQIEELPPTQKKAILNNIDMYLKGALTAGS